MNNIQYYVVVDKSTTINNEDKDEMDKIEVEIQDTKLPFSDKYVDLYLISNKKKECEEYIKNLNEGIQKYFHIEQVGSEIQYTAFIDILGFSNYIKTEITNDNQAEEFYDTFNEVVQYLQFESDNKFDVKNADFIQDIVLKYSWISDTFVVSIAYMNELKKDDENIIKQKINVIEKYQKIITNGFKIPNEKVKAKYVWLNNYLGKVLLKDEFQKNIIDK